MKLKTPTHRLAPIIGTPKMATALAPTDHHPPVAEPTATAPTPPLRALVPWSPTSNPSAVPFVQIAKPDTTICSTTTIPDTTATAETPMPTLAIPTKVSSPFHPLL